MNDSLLSNSIAKKNYLEDKEYQPYERLYKKENIYDIILVLNYNMNPTIKNKGSAIFIHVAKKNYKKTEGCVAIDKRSLIKIAKELKKSTQVKIEIQK